MLNVNFEPRDEWLDGFVTVRPPAGWVSYFSAVVRDARQATGRDLHTGEIAEPEKTGNWLGAMAYLTMLDQVGECFRPRPLPRPTPHNSTIAKALAYFQPALQDEDILAIYALRCAFSHDYGLVNVGKSKNAEMAKRLHHHFLLLSNDNTPLVEVPENRWNGDLDAPLRFGEHTRINLRRLGNMAEDIVGTVKRASEDRRLDIALRGDIDELFFRFAVTLYPED
jgi:hypothetical protein